jgi:hypothetical protein
MSLRWSDVRRTVRRRGDALAQVYPYLLRDERLHPQLALALDYFESMVGRPRAELNGEVLVQFFVDHKLARGVVASLAGWYRYRRQGFADALDAPTRARLAEAAIFTPADLRSALYDDVNQHDGGFAFETARARALLRVANRLDLPVDTVEALLVLDAEDRAPLVRLRPPPPPAQVAATYNHLVADAVLRATARVELDLASGARAFLASLARRADLLGVRLELSGWGRSERAVLHGEQDALGSWTRHGRRVVRALAHAVVRHPGALRGGWAMLDAAGGPYRCALNADFLRALAGPAPDARQPDAAPHEVLWDPRPELAALRRRDGARGWSLRNWPAARVYPDGVLFPEFTLLRGDRTWHVVLADTPALAATVARLADRLAARDDLLLVSTRATAELLAPLALPTVLLDDARPLAVLLAFASALEPRLPEAAAGPLDGLLAAVRAAGFLPLERALAVAACAEEADLAGRLAAAGPHDIHLVPGVGLYTEAFLHTLQAARAAS